MTQNYRSIFITPVLGITTFLVLKIISRSTPVTDEYCFAASVERYGLWGSFRAWNEVWSPSVGYLPTLALWSLNVEPLMISRFMSFIGLLMILMLSYASISTMVVKPSRKNSIYGSLYFFCGLIITISLIQSSSLQNLSSKSYNVLNVLNSLLIDFFLAPRDGELLQWFFGISISWQKVIFGSLLSLIILVSQLILKNKIHPISISVIGTLFLAYGPNTESVIFFLYLIFFNLYLVRIKLKYSMALIIPNALLTVTFFLTTQTSGSDFRKSKFAKLSWSEQLERIGGLSFQLIAMLCITMVITYLLVSTMRNIGFLFVTDFQVVTIWLMFSATVVGNYIVGTTSYVSSYHWISLITVFFTIGMIFWIQRIPLNKKRNGNFKIRVQSLVALLLVAASLNVLYQSSQLSGERTQKIIDRKAMNANFVNKSILSIPVIDLNERVFVYDLREGTKGISPMYGWSSNSQIKCYKNSKKSW